MEFLPKTIKTQTKIEKGLAFDAKNLISGLGFGEKNVILVSDDKIFANCEKFFGHDFISFVTETLVLKNPKPDEENIARIEENLENCDLIVALGSGVISDLCKFVSFKSGVPYVIFPSAPSMNGYLSKNASLIKNGHRKTVGATLPLAIFCDLELLKSAPKEMVKAGIGDSLCFYSCWFDWLLSHLLLETRYESECFEILMEEMAFFVENYEKFSLEDDDLLELLIKILLLSGAAMTIAGGSFPASQSEHLIAHAYAMKYPQKEEKVLHGLQIATTCLTSARIQEELISQDMIFMRENVFEKEKMAKFFGEKIAKECEKEYALKVELIKQNRKFLQMELTEGWVDYCKVLSRVLFSEQNLREIFKHFKIEVGCEALYLEKAQYDELVGCARFIRDRFTCLDL